MSNYKYLTISIDDGNPTDQKTAELLNKYDLKAIFYIPGKTIQKEAMKESGIKRIAKLCENGGQTYNRKANKGVSENEVKREIVDGKDWLEQLLGKRVISFCMPSGKFKARIVQCFCGGDLCYAKDL